MQAWTFKQDLSLNPGCSCYVRYPHTRKSQFQYWLKEQKLSACNILLRWTGCRKPCVQEHVSVTQFIFSLTLTVQWSYFPAICVKAINLTVDSWMSHLYRLIISISWSAFAFQIGIINILLCSSIPLLEQYRSYFFIQAHSAWFLFSSVIYAWLIVKSSTSSQSDEVRISSLSELKQKSANIHGWVKTDLLKLI